ncbi:hypothetical protein B0H15DRAFT_1026179 [Mycena belliarum]|uniref:Uncharacterized protein n=1 Tax=Mycena belliarum TaxID=1033014 RepID=A0AAD6TX63_9AGAR|nr:hypothetical protein B0H15DRAFT_1026179 [Mycena belliae]
MAISAAHIIAYMTSPPKANVPGISFQVRNRVEWMWGLGHTHLDDHLSEFTADPLHVFADDSLLVIPSKIMIQDVHSHAFGTKLGIRRPDIRKVYNGRTSFDYLVIPIDSKNPLPGRIVVSQVPPHIAVGTTYGKIRQQWGHLTGATYNAVRTSLVERSNIALDTTFSLYDLIAMQEVYRTWTLSSYVPPSFLSEDSDETMIEIPDTKAAVPVSRGKTDRDVGSSASCEHEPRRRLLPHELEQDINDQPSTYCDEDEDDHEESAEGDSEEDRKWLEGITSWAEGSTAACNEGMFFNDDQIQEDPRETPRVATSVDLDKPDYLLRRTNRTAL